TRASTSPARSWWATGSTTPSATAACRSSPRYGPRSTRPTRPDRPTTPPTKEAWLDIATALARLPKAELHCHVEGTMRPATVVELAHQNGIELPTSDPTELYRYTSLDSLLAVFWLVALFTSN